MSRADKARRQQAADDLDWATHQRPNVPPVPFADDPEAWESRCVGNRTQHHMAPTAKMDGKWRCGSCDRWLRPPKGRT